MDILELNRPLYFGVGEVLLSSLSWSLAQNKPNDQVVYEFPLPSTKKKRVKTAVSREKAQAILSEKLRQHGISFAGHQNTPPDELLDILRGVLPLKGSVYPAVPLVSSAAFMQTVEGVLNKDNPAAYAQIIERFYSLGGNPGETVPANTAAVKWFKAISLQEKNRLLLVLEDICNTVSGEICNGKIDISTEYSNKHLAVPVWLSQHNTPFKWFRKSWDVICSESWRDALPRRRFSDWASCILRTTMGLGYLWESRFYYRLCQVLSGNCQAVDINDFLLKDSPLLLWLNPSEKISSREVSSLIKHHVTIGDQARLELAKVELDENDYKGKDLESIVKLIREKLHGHPNRFEEIFNGNRDSGGNTLETIKYALTCRSESGDDKDFYSLFSRHGNRYLVVEPGAEWIVVVAAMSAGKPGTPTTLGQISKDLRLLGLQPDRTVIVKELERAGLATTSPDSDDALEVISAF